MTKIFRTIVDENGQVVDLEVERASLSPLRILGHGGAAREMAILSGRKPQEGEAHTLPVLLGAGMGHALKELLKNAPRGDVPSLALVDKNRDMMEAAGIDIDDPRLLYVSDNSAKEALKRLSHWQDMCGGRPFEPVIHPFYQRLDRDYYGQLREQLEASRTFNFWERARAPRFQNKVPRLLLITSRYFLVGELAEACKRIGVEARMLQLANDEMASSDFITNLLQNVVEFKPDAVLTMNHLGVDKEGLLTELLARLELPLVSWFVDNPHLVLHLFEGLSSPWLAIFTWDKDNIPSLKAQGFDHVFHLPLGTAPERFVPTTVPAPPEWKSRLSFVGNSMVFKVESRIEKAQLPPAMLEGYQDIAAAFASSPQRSVQDFVKNGNPAIAAMYEALPSREDQLAYETILTWESTRQYRTDCVSRLFDVDERISPLVVGDEGWQIAFEKEKRPWRWHPPVTYYDTLPRFYPHSEINFNTTSMQMKGAVNQRVFDVPAAGAFVLTDWREQMDELLEPGKEIVSYRHPDEIPELGRYYLAHPEERERIVSAGRKRVLECHTWDKRLESMLATLKELFGTPAASKPGTI